MRKPQWYIDRRITTIEGDYSYCDANFFSAEDYAEFLEREINDIKGLIDAVVQGRKKAEAERDEALRLAAFRGMCHTNACVERDAARQVLVDMRDADDGMRLWQWKPLIEKTLNPGE